GAAQQPPSNEPPKDEPVIAVLDGPDKDKVPLEVKLDKEATPKTLDEMLAIAMKENADIRVAEAKVREAEEEMRRARVTVSQKIVAAYHAIQVEQAVVKEYTERLHAVELLRQQTGGAKLV